MGAFLPYRAPSGKVAFGSRSCTENSAEVFTHCWSWPVFGVCGRSAAEKTRKKNFVCAIARIFSATCLAASVGFRAVRHALRNGRYLRIPAEDPRRFGTDPAIWSPIQSGHQVRVLTASVLILSFVRFRFGLRRFAGDLRQKRFMAARILSADWVQQKGFGSSLTASM